MAPVSRIMVRQVQSSSNAGTFTNGMPMTSSMGCGVWGGNITNENISLKHYMNVTWVSRPIAEDKPSEAELFGEFYNAPVNLRPREDATAGPLRPREDPTAGQARVGEDATARQA